MDGDPKVKAWQAGFYANLLERLRGIPGVESVGATSGLPMDGGHPDGQFLLMTAEEVPKSFDALRRFENQRERIGNADFVAATEGYFRALGIPLVRGRIFDGRDVVDAPHSAVITQSSRASGSRTATRSGARSSSATWTATCAC